ncbi:general secretion pathway protein GspB [Coralloluteibacterium thermophilus]|uniref:General secretion pathway protein GspB n=1 Tax=Coralloluteibacterium thermophilum TaxID=2707049 RepID=A0ABV9NMQ1_9GAMM
MSLILEALRRSERDRQLGRAPGLHVPPAPGVPMRERKSHRLWIVLVLLLAAALGWLLYERHATRSATVAAATPQAPPTPPMPRPDPPAQPVPAPAAPVPAAYEATPAPAPEARPPAAALPAPATTAEATPRAPGRPADADPATASPAAEADTPVPVWSLPGDLLQRLPPLQVSMHVYNSDPSRRFIVVDGRRAAEGDRLSPAVRVLEIRRDGSLLDIEGRPALLPRP